MTFTGRAENAAETVSNKLTPQSDLIKNPLTEDLLGQWADALSNLADQFLAGDAAVAPKSYPKTCRYCALPALCRVSQTSVVLEAEDDAASGAGDEDFISQDDADE